MSDWKLTKLRGEWAVTWTDAGGIRRRYGLGTADPKEAHRRATSRYAALARPAGKTVGELWRGYCHAKAGLAVLESMKYTWRALDGRFGNMEAGEISVDDCRAHTVERHKAGIHDGTIHTELGHLRMVLKWAENTGLIDRAPHIERPMKPEPKEYHITRFEAHNLIVAANVPHVALAIRLMLSTGARNAAALELTWDRVDLDKRMLNLRNPFDRTRRKGRAMVPINDALWTALTDAHRAALTPFVIEWAGHQVQSIRRGLTAAAEAASLPEVTPHVLRHSAAVWLAEDGHSMSEIAQFLGHSSTRITEKVYARFSPEYLRKLGPSLEF